MTTSEKGKRPVPASALTRQDQKAAQREWCVCVFNRRFHRTASEPQQCKPIIYCLILAPDGLKADGEGGGGLDRRVTVNWMPMFYT